MDVTFEVRPGYVRVQARGAWNMAEARKLLGELMGLPATREHNRVLVDGTGITTLIPIADRYDLATLLAGAASGRTRVALLMSTENMFSKTFENTAANRGIPVRTTDSLQEALAFLQLPGPED